MGKEGEGVGGAVGARGRRGLVESGLALCLSFTWDSTWMGYCVYQL